MKTNLSRSNITPIIKIAITGPESTGKSTLAASLARYYGTVWVKEYARTYLDTLGRPYIESDLTAIARGQAASEQENHQKSRRFLFCDTDPLVLKIWSDHKYGRVAPEILDWYSTSHYDYYLLMDIDLPWVYDPLREHPDERAYFFNWFRQELKIRNAPFSIIRGSEDQRLKNAISVIEQLFSGSA